jgi:hypothetical protein
MSPAQKRIILLLSIAIALTRFLAVARTLFDWDEALFSLGVQDFDVALYRPHPPGYPLFVAAAKVVHLLGVSEFRSLQVIVLLGAFALFPALFFLAREIGFDFTTSTCGAAIFAFLPNVWVYSGTGFSDVPATALGFAACALLLRGRSDTRAYLLGAMLLGAAAGFRPPNLLIGAVPALMATGHRLKTRQLRSVAAAILLGGAVVAGSYLGAALASSSIHDYIEAVRIQSQYVRDIDSWRNPARGPLAGAAKAFFLFPVDKQVEMTGLALLSLLSLLAATVQRRLPAFLTLAMFGPFAVLAWLNLDVNTASRYAISYMAVHALLAADGLRIAGRQPRVQAALAAAVVVVFSVWTWPALRTQRTTDAPPVAALEWIRRNVSPETTTYVHAALTPQVTFLLQRHKVVMFESTGEIPLTSNQSWVSKSWVVDWRIVPGGMNFVRPHNALWHIIRQRNFETSVSRVASIVDFGQGWYAQEGEGASVFHWMSKESHTTLPPVPGKGRLSIRMYVPVDTIHPPPTIEIDLNGVLLDRFVGSEAEIARSWIVESRTNATNELRMVTSATVNLSRVSHSSDTRDLGLRINALTWTPLD